MSKVAEKVADSLYRKDYISEEEKSQICRRKKKKRFIHMVMKYSLIILEKLFCY